MLGIDPLFVAAASTAMRACDALRPDACRTRCKTLRRALAELP